MAEYPSAQDMFVDESHTFIDALQGLPGDQLTIVVHKTGGTPSLASLNNYFQNDPERKSVHFGIDLDGSIGQFVLLKDGAGGNCCVEQGYDQYWTPFLNQYGNLNRCTISIEHIDPTPDNSTPMPDVQKQASFRLIAWLCHKFNIASSHIKGHNTIDPIDRARCPGPTYPWSELFAFLQGGTMNGVPAGWTDANNVLTAPNGVHVVKGFREYVLNNNWDADNWPLQVEAGRDPVEDGNPSLGSGTWQPFRWKILVWTSARGVYEMWVGQELLYARQHQGTGLDPVTVKNRLTAMVLAAKQVETLGTQPL